MPRRIDTDLLDKRRQAVELRLAGATYAVIADRLGYANHGSARKAVLVALKTAIREPAAEVLDRELERLDTMLLGLWAQARRGDVVAIDRVLKIMDRRAKYLGLDKVQVDVTTHDGDLQDLDAALAALVTGQPVDP
jgi:hypothetical protein